MPQELLAVCEKISNIDRLNVYNGHPVPPSYNVRKAGYRDYSRFLYVIKGTFVFDAQTENQLEAHAGDIIYLPSGIAHTCYWEKENNSEYISVNCTLLDSGGKQICLTNKIIILATDTNQKFLNIFKNIHRIFYSRPNNWQLLFKANFYTFLAKAMEKNSFNDLQKHPTAHVAGEGVAWMEFDYFKNIPLEKFAKGYGVSKSTFLRNFKKLTGMSPIAYRNKIRLEHAYECLETGIYTVAEVATMVGFNDIPYFSREFKKKFGISPSECIALGGKKKNKD